MASLVLGIAGQAAGSALIGSGFSFLGATITGAEIGGAIGTLIGQQIDSALMPGTTIKRQGPRLSDVNIQSSTEGAAIPRVFGRVRVAGQLLWATKFKETASTTKTQTGGKGGPSTTVDETDYTYSISFAVGLCAGVATKIGRVWADGTLIDLSGFTTRFYAGDETQSEDPLIQEIEGDGNTPGVLLLNPAGPLAAGTITMPAHPKDGQICRMASSQTITALTLAPASGQSLTGALTALSAGGFAEYLFVASASTWFRIG